MIFVDHLYTAIFFRKLAFLFLLLVEHIKARDGHESKITVRDYSHTIIIIIISERKINTNRVLRSPAGDQEAVEGDAGDNREAVEPGADDGRKLLYERSTPLHGQVEGRGSDEDGDGRGGTAVAHDRHRPAPSERRFVTHVRPRGVPRRVARGGPALLVRAG